MSLNDRDVDGRATSGIETASKGEGVTPEKPRAPHQPRRPFAAFEAACFLSAIELVVRKQRRRVEVV